jgi:hypothetical protein
MVVSFDDVIAAIDIKQLNSKNNWLLAGQLNS